MLPEPEGYQDSTSVGKTASSPKEAGKGWPVAPSALCVFLSDISRRQIDLLESGCILIELGELVSRVERPVVLCRHFITSEPGLV
jgi:hypothetical protein